jgi:pilus assembly protein Flp/PilA
MWRLRPATPGPCQKGAIAMTKLFVELARDRKGATAIEYGLIAAFIALAMVAALPGIKTALSAKFQSVNASLQ